MSGVQWSTEGGRIILHGYRRQGRAPRKLLRAFREALEPRLTEQRAQTRAARREARGRTPVSWLDLQTAYIAKLDAIVLGEQSPHADA